MTSQDHVIKGLEVGDQMHCYSGRIFLFFYVTPHRHFFKGHVTLWVETSLPESSGSRVWWV